MGTVVTFTETVTAPPSLAAVQSAMASMVDHCTQLGIDPAEVTISSKETAGYSDFRESSPGRVTYTATVVLKKARQ
ncbi:hypothetical protein [Rhodococcoides fascians]|uniref:hypothetical protein n=1 Tax=Rhodococcoides fascians TaxID=1828 RepID=UPI000A8D63F7|nr:hypothetical protein [Rhodococcus fascians]